MKIGITNIKGGVGKSTIAQNLAVCVAHSGNSVQIIDTDTNQNSIDWAAARDEELPQILAVGCQNERMISKIANSINESFDFVIMDGSPHMGKLTTSIMITSDILLIPITTSTHDVRAFGQFVERLRNVQQLKEANGEKLNAYLILNMYKNHNVQKQLAKILESFEIPIINSKLNQRTAYVESALEGRGVLEWSDKKASEEFLSLTREIFDIAESLGFIE